MSSAVESFVVELLRGDVVDLSRMAVHPQPLLDYCHRQGVVSLVAERLAGRSDVPPALHVALRSEAQREAVADMVREPELRRLLETLAPEGVEALVIKGAQLAYTIYPRPHLRQRMDTDLLIPIDARERMHTVMLGLGYVASVKVSGDLAIPQKSYARTVDGVEVHSVDVHWQIANPQQYAQALGFDELRAAAVPIPALGPHAVGPSPVHALVLAGVHLHAHHRGDRRLKWIYDVHLLAGAFGIETVWEAIRRADARQLSQAVMQTLVDSARLFRTASLEPFLAIRHQSRPGQRRRLLRELEARTQATQVLDDLRRLPSWRTRLQLLREHLFPSRAYMTEMYSPASRLPLPVLYLTRILRGAPRWFRGARS